MIASSYSLRPDDSLLLHGATPRLLRDHNELTDIDIKALVASGDCLITLATALDGTTRLLETEPAAVQPQVERIIRTLLHLQRHYKLIRKPADHSQ